MLNWNSWLIIKSVTDRHFEEITWVWIINKSQVYCMMSLTCSCCNRHNIITVSLHQYVYIHCTRTLMSDLYLQRSISIYLSFLQMYLLNWFNDYFTSNQISISLMSSPYTHHCMCIYEFSSTRAQLIDNKRPMGFNALTWIPRMRFSGS